MTNSIPPTPPRPTFSPRTHRWSTQRRLFFGLLALLPGLLLWAAVATAIGATAAEAGLLVPAVLTYTHVGVQLLVLMIFGHLMLHNRQVSKVGKLVWGAYFVLLAPAAVLAYWYVHVWRAEGREEVSVSVRQLAPAA